MSQKTKAILRFESEGQSTEEELEYTGRTYGNLTKQDGENDDPYVRINLGTTQTNTTTVNGDIQL
jgi:hypothetical protein